MSLKFGLTIGAIWTGVAAFTASEKALKTLKNRVLQLNQKKLNLKLVEPRLPAAGRRRLESRRAMTECRGKG